MSLRKRRKILDTIDNRHDQKGDLANLGFKTKPSF